MVIGYDDGINEDVHVVSARVADDQLQPMFGVTRRPEILLPSVLQGSEVRGRNGPHASMPEVQGAVQERRHGRNARTPWALLPGVLLRV